MSEALSPELPPPPLPVRGTRLFALDLASSYLLSLARIGAAAGIIAVLYRYTTPEFVAVFVLARSMLAIINLLFSGTGPATLHELSREEQQAAQPRTAEPLEAAAPPDRDGPVALEYARPQPKKQRPEAPRSLHTYACQSAAGIGALVWFACLFYGAFFGQLHDLTGQPKLAVATTAFIPFFALGLLLRVTSDPAGAAMQRRSRLWLDNLIQAAGELTWLALAFALVQYRYTDTLINIGLASAVTGLAVLMFRLAFAPRGPFLYPSEFPAMAGRWIGACAAIAVGSMGDLLYGSASVLIINQTLGRNDLADYAPAMQIDGALLLGVSAITAVVLPRVSTAFGRGDVAGIRRMYLRAMLASVLMLAAGAGVVLLFRDVLLRAWLGTVPPQTRDILPLILIHTVVGGTAGVGRAVLLGMGRFRPYTISSLLGGAANVFLALLFVLGFDMGLRGIVCATIIAVTLRCAIWMPWYILRALRSPLPAGRG